jgi:hypothetical protein
LRGWAADPDAPAERSVLRVYVDGRFFEEVRANGLSRPDVQSVHPWASRDSGWMLTVPNSDAQVCVYAMNVGAGSNNTTPGCLRTPAGSPAGWLDSVDPGYSSVARIRGWARDPDTRDPVELHVYVDGRFLRSLPTGFDRPDLGGAYGFDHIVYATFPPAAGTHEICVSAVDPVSQAAVPLQGGCKQVVVTTEPFGQLDSVVREGDFVLVQGWMIDPREPRAPVGITGTTTTFNSVVPTITRSDVDAAFPGYSFPTLAFHYAGFMARMPVTSEPTTICAYPWRLPPEPQNLLPGCTTV